VAGLVETEAAAALAERLAKEAGTDYGAVVPAADAVHDEVPAAVSFCRTSTFPTTPCCNFARAAASRFTG
jgi:hypothetical protein